MHKKGIIILTIITFFTSIICFLGYKIVKKQTENEEIKSIKATLPKLEFYNLDSTKFQNTVLKENFNHIFIHFNTECEHCQAEAQLIHENINAFKNAQIVMVTPNTPKEILAFTKQYGIAQHPEILVLWDKDYRFVDWFGSSPFPSVYIYNRKQKLVKEYHGEVKIEAITKYIN
jgi:thiol-disulfide isomerase/thioredoxin